MYKEERLMENKKVEEVQVKEVMQFIGEIEAALHDKFNLAQQNILLSELKTRIIKDRKQNIERLIGETEILKQSLENM